MAFRHYDALDFDLYDRWRVRLHDVPSSIGWGAVALFLRHLPRDSETMREMVPSAIWSGETHVLAYLADLVGDLFANDYEHIERPWDVPTFSTAEPVGESELDRLLARFRMGGDTDG